MPPAECVQLRDIQLLARHAVGLACIEDDVRVRIDDAGDQEHRFGTMGAKPVGDGGLIAQVQIVARRRQQMIVAARLERATNTRAPDEIMIATS
ncbi:MAG: hypothetical protein ACHQO8_08515 [Vicinamibacterales bacterium]